MNSTNSFLEKAAHIAAVIAALAALIDVGINLSQYFTEQSSPIATVTPGSPTLGSATPGTVACGQDSLFCRPPGQ
ncbi:MAG: hypothetical protein EAZ94_09755 [Oscillatoriales cyanobacterium]|nr:MAG: hypothetical protein EAZ94_09755 [Oscillatoriales cyanobacterium]TAE21074.1 MAG: hypothetical protein EAZ93_21565 [Oscillatoriales cyanobacterium]